jgi:dihydroorotase-like cyclic amidohydrolase
MKLLLKNATLLDLGFLSNNVKTNVDILIEGSRIKEIGTDITDEGASVIHVGGNIVAPGLVDVHVHFSIIFG